MAHVKVERRSMSQKQWAQLEFARIEKLVTRQNIRTDNWKVRIGQYFPEKYIWDGDFQPISDGDLWGRPDGTAEFRSTIKIPQSMKGHKVWFSMLTGAEVIVYKNGQMLDGIDPNRTRILLTEKAQPGELCEITMEAYVRSKPDDERSLKTENLRGSIQCFNIPQLLVIDEDALELHYDLSLLYEMAFGDSIAEDLQIRLQRQIEGLIRLFPPYDCEIAELNKAIGQISEFLKTRVYRETPVFGHQGKLACVAHSHLDIAYHWKVGQTVQKNARTCLIQLRLMDRYPDFTYAHTQAWTYEMLEEFYPDLFEEVKQRISEGRWEIVGGMYVEPDCNIPSAESLVRQVIYGKLYFLEKFGVEVDNCWLPDVFGNSAILPQILKLGGSPYFVSNKMSTWNDTNLFPHNNFMWKGLDGSEVHACVPPVHFISWMDPNDLAKHWETFLDKDWCDESLHMYGYGDGGSGVTEEMLETFPRLKKMGGLPQIRQTTGKEYLHTVFDDKNSSELPVWDGELYLEMHRGTFTTKSDLKWLNRKGELQAYEVETLCAMAASNGMVYPVEGIRKTWKKLLLNQFHDIVPGSHTQPVFLDAMETYGEMLEEFDTLKTNALNNLAPLSEVDDVSIFNPFIDYRSGIAILTNDRDKVSGSGKSMIDSEGKNYPIQNQYVPRQDKPRIVTAISEIPSLSSKNFKLIDTGQSQINPSFKIKPSYMENQFFRLDFDENRSLVSVLDKKRNRQVLPPGTIGNEWQLFEDKPGKYNAWDVLPNYEDHKIEMNNWQNVEIVEEGPLSIALKFTRTFSKSKAELVIRLHAEIPRIDFESWVDWKETEKLLKVAFPVTVKSRYFTTDTSAGGLERENHRNTSWQKARFEVAMHKWVDMSEGLFGVSLLNDSKYGCDVQNNVMRLSLLRAPIRPDRVSDKGEHRFTYSLCTHSGDWRTGGTTEAAYDLNHPLTALVGRRSRMPENKFVLTIDNPALKCQSFKCAEDGSGDFIVRVVEVYGSHGSSELKTSFEFSDVTICDLLERTLETVFFSGKKVDLPYRPYQIQTLRFRRKQ